MKISLENISIVTDHFTLINYLDWISSQSPLAMKRFTSQLWDQKTDGLKFRYEVNA